MWTFFLPLCPLLSFSTFLSHCFIISSSFLVLLVLLILSVLSFNGLFFYKFFFNPTSLVTLPLSLFRPSSYFLFPLPMSPRSQGLWSYLWRSCWCCCLSGSPLCLPPHPSCLTRWCSNSSWQWLHPPELLSRPSSLTSVNYTFSHSCIHIL